MQETLILHLQQWIDHLDTRSIKKEGPWMIHWIRWTWQIYLELYIPKQWNILSSRVHMEHSPSQITYWVTKHPFISRQELRSYHAYFQTFTIHSFILSAFHNAIKLEVNHRKKSGKPPKAWRLKNTLLTNEWVNQAIREAIWKYMETNENENTTIQKL